MKNTFILLFLIISWGIINAQCKIDYSQYHLIVDENFNTTIQDLSTRWNFSDAGTDPNSGYGAEVYDPSKVSILPGGICRLTATKLANPYVVPRGSGELRTVRYVSGTLRSKMTPDNGCWAENLGFTYGIFEMRAKLPAGATGVYDVWPTFWLYSGPTEIDIMDDITGRTATEWRSGMIDWKKYPDQNTTDWVYVSDCINCSHPQFLCDNDYSENDYVKYGNKVYRALHYNKRVCCGMDAQKRVIDLSQSYNTYTVAWTPDKVTFFFNGREVYTISSNVISTYQCAADIRASLQMMDAATMQEAYMDIDYIKVWKPNNGNYITTPFKSALGWVNSTFSANYVQNPVPLVYSTSSYYNCIAVNHFDENEFFYIGSDQKIYRRKEGSGVPLTHGNISGTETTTSGITFNTKFGIVTYRDINGTLKFINSWSDGTFHTNFFNAVNASANDLKVLVGANCVVNSKFGDVFYVGIDNKIHRLRQTSGVWYHQILGTYDNANSKTTGELALDENDNSSTITVYYKGIDNRLQAIWFNSSVSAYQNTFIDQNWTTGDYLINSSRKGVLKYSASLGALYIGADGKLHRFYFANNTWNHELSNYTYIDGEFIKGGLEWDNTTNMLYYVGTNGKIQSFNRTIRIENGVLTPYWKHTLIDDYQDSPEYRGYVESASVPNTSMLQSCFAGKKIIYNSFENLIRAFEYKDCEFPADCSKQKYLNKPGQNKQRFLVNQNEDNTLALSVKKTESGPAAYSLSPNPVDDILNIRSSSNSTRVFVSVVNLSGKSLLEKEYIKADEILLDFSEYASGVYLIRIRDANGQHVYKVSKK